MNDPETGRQDALSGQQPRSFDYGYQAAHQAEVERQRMQAGWQKIHEQARVAGSSGSSESTWSSGPTSGGSLGANFVLIESLLVGGLTALVLWQVHPVLGIVGFFAGMFGFMFLFAIPVVKNLLSIGISLGYARFGWAYADRQHLDLIWHAFIAIVVFGVSYFTHWSVARTMSVRRLKRKPS